MLSLQSHHVASTLKQHTGGNTMWFDFMAIRKALVNSNGNMNVWQMETHLLQNLPFLHQLPASCCTHLARALIMDDDDNDDYKLDAALGICQQQQENNDDISIPIPK
jgi:hypothetical protein